MEDALLTKEAYMLTTIDNPFNPFTQFDEWNAYDEEKGYHTSSYLARLAYTSDDLDDEMNQIAINDAILEILKTDVTGMYIRVKKDSVIKPIPIQTAS